MGLVGFECSLRGEKKLFLEKENLESVLSQYLSPASFLNLKM